MTPWDSQSLQKDFERHEHRKQSQADRCRAQMRFGKADYGTFYDEETAEQMVAFVLKTDAALERPELLLDRLTELRSQVAQGGLDATGIHSRKTYRRAATRYIDQLISRFTSSA